MNPWIMTMDELHELGVLPEYDPRAQHNSPPKPVVDAARARAARLLEEGDPVPPAREVDPYGAWESVDGSPRFETPPGLMTTSPPASQRLPPAHDYAGDWLVLGGLVLGLASVVCGGTGLALLAGGSVGAGLAVTGGGVVLGGIGALALRGAPAHLGLDLLDAEWE